MNNFINSAAVSESNIKIIKYYKVISMMSLYLQVTGFCIGISDIKIVKSLMSLLLCPWFHENLKVNYEFVVIIMTQTQR